MTEKRGSVATGPGRSPPGRSFFGIVGNGRLRLIGENFCNFCRL
jgi:hypothetical protein